jgi:hypothetical protein
LAWPMGDKRRHARPSHLAPGPPALRDSSPSLGDGCAVLIPEFNLDEAGCRRPRSFPNGELMGQQTRSFTIIGSRPHHPRLHRRAVDRSGPTVWTSRSARNQQLINFRVARSAGRRDSGLGRHTDVPHWVGPPSLGHLRPPGWQPGSANSPLRRPSDSCAKQATERWWLDS